MLRASGRCPGTVTRVPQFADVPELGLDRVAGNSDHADPASLVQLACSGTTLALEVLMSEFMFRNLSVKLFPVEGEARRACEDQATLVEQCTPCTNLCTGTVPPACEHQGCTREPSIPIAVGPKCDGPGTSPGYVDTVTSLILPAGDVRTQLAVLKASLQRNLAVVEARERDLETVAKPTSIEGIDRLKAQLLDAVAELDEQRARMQGGGSAPHQDEQA